MGAPQLAPAAVDAPPLTVPARAADRWPGRQTSRCGSERANCSSRPTRRCGGEQHATLEAAVARMFRFDADLSGFYALVEADDALGWAAKGARENFGESHGFRRRRQNDLHHELCLVGDDSHDAGARRTRRGCVPRTRSAGRDRRAMVRRGRAHGVSRAYVLAIARAVADETLDLETPARRASSSRCRRRGVAAGAARNRAVRRGARHAVARGGTARWSSTRGRGPTYLAISGRSALRTRTIRRAFARYGAYAGLAFWLYLTRDWVDE